jgi:hypothetical protein
LGVNTNAEALADFRFCEGLSDAGPMKVARRARGRRPQTFTEADMPAGAIAGWDLHPLESAAFARRTPDQQTFLVFVGMSQTCQRTKLLRDSPLRGSKSREAGSRSRRQRWRGGKVNTVSSCIVGQRMINSKDHLAGRHPDAASHIDPAITQ